MSAWSFVQATLLNSRSPACCWRHPRQAVHLVAGMLQNMGAALAERWPGGGQHSCPVCEWRGRRFRTFLSADEVIPDCICPRCGSFDRQRHLVIGLRNELNRQPPVRPQVLLGFSLAPAVHWVLQREGLPRCFRTDIARDKDRFAPDFVTDLRRVGVATAAIDWIFCSHVLEHIDDLDACLAEMARLLRPGGVAWIQVPLEPGLDRSYRIEVDPHRAHAHAWRFGRDFSRLLRRPDWAVVEIVAGETLLAGICQEQGIDPTERYWLARKI